MRDMARLTDLRNLKKTARKWSGDLIQRGSESYDRARDAPRLLPRLFAERAPDRLEILDALQHALVRERRLGACGHWGYDLARHARLAQALAAEQAQQQTAEITVPDNEKRHPHGWRHFKP